MNKKEIKIFFTFFIIYSFFVYWVGWNEQSRFILTRAIVDEGRFEVDNYANQTSDRDFYKGHYYSDKEPGMSFLAIPIYTTWKFVYYNFFPKNFIAKYSGTNDYITTYVGKGVPITDLINPGFFILNSMILITIFTSSLFSALTVVLIYKISKYFTNKERHRMLLVYVSGLGTLIFPYSLVFLEYATATFFSFFAFYLLFKVKEEKINDKKYIIFSGLSSSFALFFTKTTIIIWIACLFYIIYFKKMKIIYFILGSFLGFLPFFLYTYTVFGAVFINPRLYLDQTIWGINSMSEDPRPFTILRLMFYPHKGLFFYYPILLLSFIGLYWMHKKFKIESILVIFVFIIFLAMNSGLLNFGGGACFGSKYLTPTIPFLVLPLAYVFDNFNSRKLKYLVFILIVYSIFINFAGLQPVRDELIAEDGVNIAPQYLDKLNSFSILNNPLYEYYIPQFLKYGPRSRILENLINSKFPIDIRFFLFEQREAFSSFYLSIPFLSLLPITLITLFIWRNEIFTKNRKAFFSKYKWSILILFSLISLTILLLFPIPTEGLVLGMRWYPQSPNEQGRWMKDDGEILIPNSEDKNKTASINFYIQSYYMDRNIDLYFNDELIDNFYVFKEGSDVYTPFLTLKPGKNTLKLHSYEKCTSIAEVTKTRDYRCVSIRLTNITLLPYDEITDKTKFLYNKNWYDKAENEEVKWMSNNGTVSLFYWNDSLKKIILEFYFIPFNNKKTVYFYLNDILFNVFNVSKDGGWVHTAPLSLNFGLNTLKFHVKEGCIVISNILKNNDKRCVSIGIKDIRFKSQGD